MTTNSEKFNAGSPLVQSTTENEIQPSSGDTFHRVLINEEYFTVRTDRKGAFLGGKNFGHGIHVFQNGNINIQTGPKKDGNGKLVTVCRGGQIIKSGPIAAERTGYRKSFLQEGEDDEIIAVEEYNTGNVVSETHGTQTIKATNLVIEADDTLILKAPGGITIDTNGNLNIINVNNIEEFYNEKIENGNKLTHNVLERSMKTSNPNSSDNIVISGHINRRIGGDYDMDIKGVSATRVLGKDITLGLPLCTNRLYGFHIGLNAPSAGFGGMNIESKTGSVKINAGVDLQLSAKALFNISSIAGLGTISTGANLNLKSATGISMTSGGLSLPSLINNDITIKSDNDIIIDAAKDVDIDAGSKIYLN